MIQIGWSSPRLIITRSLIQVFDGSYSQWYGHATIYNSPDKSVMVFLLSCSFSNANTIFLKFNDCNSSSLTTQVGACEIPRHLFCSTATWALVFGSSAIPSDPKSLCNLSQTTHLHKSTTQNTGWQFGVAVYLCDISRPYYTSIARQRV